MAETKENGMTNSMEKSEEEEDKEEKDKPWSTLLMEFTQTTTFHGVRYITAETPYVIRRIIWTVVVLAATSFFFWFMSERLIYLRSNPKAVDVEVIYTDSVDFPAVTICNQNLFRTTETHKLGLHDIVEESFRKLNADPSHSAKKEIYEDNAAEGFMTYYDNELVGIGRPQAIYVDVTSQVCRHVCVKLHSDSCCSVMYERATRTCYVTPMDMKASGARLVPKTYVDYFHRRKCQVQTSANCTFDTDLCSFVSDQTKTLSWQRVQWEAKLDGKFPAFDHSTMTSDGWYLQAHTKYHQPDSVAHLLSTNILSGQDTCIQFYYQIRSGVLNVRTMEHGAGFTTVWSAAGSDSREWERGYLQLPAGYFRVVIEATSSKGAEPLNIALDDVAIGSCQRDNKCKESLSGKGYSGVLATTLSKKECKPWTSIPEYLKAVVWKGQEMDIVNTMLPSLNNYCRNPDNDVIGPWCFTDVTSGQMDYCDIPLCECRSVEYACANGRCISRDLLCDGKDDCGDLSDEIQACNFTGTVTCDFEDTRMCGYVGNSDDATLTWTLKGTDLTLGAAVETTGARPGDRAQLTSPLVSVETHACLQLSHFVTWDAILDVYMLHPNKTGVTSRTRICSLTNDVGTWNASYIFLPPGEYNLMFDAIIDDPATSVVYIDNVTLLNENCTREIAFSVLIPNTFNDTWFNTTENDTMTTEMTPVTTMMTSIVGPASYIYATKSENCSTCIQYFAPPEDCETGFKLVMGEDSDLQSLCDNVGRLKGINEAECMSYAMDIGGNVINYRHRHCIVGHCEDDDLQLFETRQGGGYKIYVLDSPDEPLGISCSFKDRCACGYSYYSSNAYDFWLREPMYMAFTKNGTTNETEQQVHDFYMTVSNTKGNRQRKGDFTRLISPLREIEKPSCLRFQYFTRYMDFKILKYTTEGDTELLLDVLHDGQERAWHTAYIDAPVGYYGVMVEYHFREVTAQENAGIDNITLLNTTCYEMDYNRPFDCSFDEDDYCGYKDMSTGVTKWIRSKQFDEDSPGGYYLRTSTHHSKKASTVLASPFSQISNESCLQFYYFTHKADFDIKATLALSVHEGETHNRTTIWRVRPVLDNSWYFGQVELPVGYYQLIFEIHGESIRTGIDSVTVVDAINGSCPMLNCTGDQFKCTSNEACIPSGNLCDGFPNCYLAEDENNYDCAVSNETVIEEEEEVDALEDAEREKILESAKTTGEVGTHLNLTEIYMRAAHQGEDFIYSCKWEGRTCNEVNFTKSVTDYGVCYTFNSGEFNLSTAKTGSRFGLSLTLNIEQYEYMLGPQSDAGIKVFLHVQDELPQVRDLGFAIPPGTHALVGVRLNEAINLEKPWGDCSEKELKYYKGDYVHSRCIRECETKDVVAICGCRDAYMPGYTVDNPPICNLSKYFSCAIPAINSVDTMQECECPKPCRQIIYEPSLSQASLSVLSVDSILSKDQEVLLKKYRKALSARQRIDPDDFETDLMLLSNVERLYRDNLKFAKSYLGDFETSSLAMISSAASTLVKKIFREDIEIFLGDIDKYITAYKNRYHDILELINIYQADTKTCLKELEQLVKTSIQANTTNRFLPAVSKNCYMRVELTQQTLETYDKRKHEDIKRAESPDTWNKVMPVTQNPKNKQCEKEIITMHDSLAALANILENDLGQEAGTVVPPSYETHVLPALKSNITLFFMSSPKVAVCLGEYSTMLKNLKAWLTKVYDNADELAAENIFVAKTYNYTIESEAIENDMEEVENLYMKYAYGTISKLDYLENFKADDASSEVLSRIDSFVERIKSRLTDPLRQRIQSIRKDLERFYYNAFRKAAEFETYLIPNSFYEKSEKMKIWRVPKPNLDNPERVQDEAREHWKVWDRDTDIQVFARQMALAHLSHGLDTYCTPLLKGLDSFEEQLLLNKQKLITAMSNIQVAYNEYVRKRVIDHNFVLDNFLTMDVYFAQLKHQSVKQIIAYQITQFLGDVGGFMGLLLGGSVLTVFELLDLLVFNSMNKFVAKGTQLTEQIGNQLSSSLSLSRDKLDKDKLDNNKSDKSFDRSKDPNNIWNMNDDQLMGVAV